MKFLSDVSTTPTYHDNLLNKVYQRVDTSNYFGSNTNDIVRYGKQLAGLI